MWQKCPVCGGTGSTGMHLEGSVLSCMNTCKVCNGYGIINSITGLPRQGYTSTNITTGSATVYVRYILPGNLEETINKKEGNE